MSIGVQLKRRRLSLGLSMQDVVDRLDRDGAKLTKASLSKYENDKSIPRATALWALAKVLECSTEFFLAEPKAEIEWLRFRKKSSLPKVKESEIKEKAREWIEAWMYFSSVIDQRIAKLDLPQKRIQSLDDAEALSKEVRETWGVGIWPIESVAAALEKSGVIVVEVDASAEVDGLSGTANDHIRFVVAKAGVPADRMRMNLAHECGHIVINSTEDAAFEEAAAYRFAAALLIPDTAIYESIGCTRKNIDMREFLILKQEYGISIQALIRRCYDLNVISEWTYRRLNIQLRVLGRHRHEPGQLSFWLS